MIRVRLICILIAGLLTAAFAVRAQTTPLPADLYVLTNAGIVERYAIGQVGAVALTPPETFVIDFGIDARGERIAFRTEDGIQIGLLGADGALQAAAALEGSSAGVPSYRGRGDSIAWSPDGAAIAYITLNGARVHLDTAVGASFIDLNEGVFVSLTWSPGGTFLAAEGENNVWWLYRREGAQLMLSAIIPSSVGTAWVSDGEIVFAPQEGGLKLMNLNAANAQTTLLSEEMHYRLPYLTADDRLVFFARMPGDPAVPEGYGRLQRLARGASQVETVGAQAIPLSGLRWAPGGRLMIALQGGAIALYDPISGAALPFSVNNAVAYAWGPAAPETPPPLVVPPTTNLSTAAPTPTEPPFAWLPTPQPVSGLILSDNSFFFAPVGDFTQVWMLPANGQPPFRFTGANNPISEFTLSPDGRNVAYVSGGSLWVQRFELRQPFVAAVLNSFAPSTPVFSPDGTRIAYVDESVSSGGIWIATLDGREPTRALANIVPGSAGYVEESDARLYRRPQWSPDGARLLLDVYRADGIVNGVLELATGDLAETPFTTPDDARPLTARWLSSDRIITYNDALLASPSAPGFYITDPLAPDTEAAGATFPLPEGSVVRAVRPIAPEQIRALLTDSADPSGALRVIDFSAAAQEEILVLPPLAAPRLSADVRFVAGLINVQSVDGIPRGQLVIVDLNTGGQFLLTTPETIWGFVWPR